MENILGQQKIHRIEKTIAILYIYLLPVRMITQLSWIKNLLHGAGYYLDVILLTLGIFLYLIRTRGKIYIGREDNSKLLQYFGEMIIFLNLSSIIMACVIQSIYGNHGSESAFDGISGMLVYFTQYFLMFWYNREVFKLISKEELTKIIHRICILLLILGWWQFCCMNFGGIFSTVYDKINIFGIFLPSNFPKLSLTGSEGASAGDVIGIFVLPFLFSQLLTSEKKGKYIFEVLLWLPVIYMTRSSTAYILVSASTIVFLLYLFKEMNSKSLVVVTGIVGVIVLAVYIYPDVLLNILPDKISVQIKYLLFEKISDLNNGSTAARSVPFITNWGAFTEFPILGVGNGLQGYFYEKYFPNWAFHVAGSDVLMFYERAQKEIVNGGIFFPSLLSGYGIVGVTLVIGYIVKAHKYVKRNKQSLGAYYYFYRIACISILLSGFQGDFSGTFYIWFVLSIPYMSINKKNNCVDKIEGDFKK